MLSRDEAIRQLRDDPEYAALIRDSYLGTDLSEAAERFSSSAEFAEVQRLLEYRVRGCTVLDLGAGNGIASYAFAKSGASLVYALEPDPGEVGREAISRLQEGKPIQVVDAFAEDIPLPEGTVDIVYARQVLHHTHNLFKVLSECARVLKRGGLFLACREHVVDDENQLQAFLDRHPLHILSGGENAFQLSSYIGAINAAGLRLHRLIGPWDSIINAFPVVKTPTDLERFPRTALKRRLGPVGAMVSVLPGVNALVWARLRRRRMPGRMYTFLASKS